MMRAEEADDDGDRDEAENENEAQAERNNEGTESLTGLSDPPVLNPVEPRPPKVESATMGGRKEDERKSTLIDAY